MARNIVKKKLDPLEREIEDAAESFRQLSKKQRRKIERILSRVRKARNINIRP